MVGGPLYMCQPCVHIVDKMHGVYAKSWPSPPRSPTRPTIIIIVVAASMAMRTAPPPPGLSCGPGGPYYGGWGAGKPGAGHIGHCRQTKKYIQF